MREEAKWQKAEVATESCATQGGDRQREREMGEE